MTAQPAWQLPMTAGLPSALGCSAITRSRNVASARAMSSIVCPGTGSGKKADEVAGVPCLEGDADLALWFEAANAGPMSGARIDNDERSFALVYFAIPRAA